ncbi:MAG: hypothetical protein GWN07_30280, partial [Actinobacteria bacterium]|nr:hypothetical protein [Actinomycetota bacterium]NIU69666.1 hypothetical protein [Actinomycetota bacterium]NIW31532.1 hypothetical protein [Actinomycetota bacterium]NIX23875.1 hypothetical protein [Actinomycetota bacterium]
MGPQDPVVDGEFRCVAPDSQACLAGSWWTCESDGEFLRRVEDRCIDRGEICIEDQGGCALCFPESL